MFREHLENRQDNYAITSNSEALSKEQYNKNTKILKSLLDSDQEFGCYTAMTYINQGNINLVGKNGSFLHHLVRNNEVELIKILKQTYPTTLKIDIVDERGLTPLQCLLNGEYGCFINPDLALELASDYKSQDQHGNTLLHHFVMGKCKPEYIQSLVNRAPEILVIKNNNDKTASELLLNGQSPENATGWKKQVIEYFPCHYKRAAESFLEKKKYEISISTCNDAIKILGKRDIRAYSYEELRADVYLAKGEPDKAIEEYSNCIELLGTEMNYEYHKGNIFNKIGSIYMKKGDFKTAFHQFEKSVSLYPNDSSYYLKASALFELGLHEAAIAACNGSISRIPDDDSFDHRKRIFNCRLLLAKIYFHQKNAAKAFSELNFVITYPSDSNNGERKAIKETALEKIIQLLSSDIDLSNIDKNDIKAILLSTGKLPVNKQLELLYHAQDATTALYQRLIKSENILLNIMDEKTAPSLFTTSINKGTMGEVQEMIMKIKLDQINKHNNQFFSSCSNTREKEDECWLQDQDPNAVPLQPTKK